MATREDSRRYLENRQEEIDSAAEYRAMAEAEPDARLARVYGNLARMEEAHITFWEASFARPGLRSGRAGHRGGAACSVGLGEG